MQNQDDNPYKKVVLKRFLKRKRNSQKQETGPFSVTMSDMYNMNKRSHMNYTLTP